MSRVAPVRLIKPRNPKLLAAVLAVPAIAAMGQSALATNLYWDANGATAGSGSSPVGTWGTSNFWSNDPTGSSSTGAWVSGSTAVFAAGTDSVGTYTVTVSGNMTAGGITVEEANVIFSGGTLTLNGGAPVDIQTSGTTTIGSVITGTGAAGTPNFTKAGTGTLLLTGINTFTGGFAVTGGTLVMASGETTTTSVNTGVVPTQFVANYVQLSNGASLKSNNTAAGAGTFLASNKGITLGAGGGAIENVANGTNFLIYFGSISGTGQLIKRGGGIIALSHTTGADTFTGGILVEAGTLRLRTNPDKIPDSNPLTVNSGATFDFGGIQETLGSLSGSGVVLLSGTATDSVGADNASSTFSGTISSATTSTFAKVGTGTLTISSNTGNTAKVTISGSGKLQVGNGGTTGDIGSGAITVTGASSVLEYNRSNAMTVSNAISGTGQVLKSQNNVLTISGQNWANTGGVTIAAGTIKFGDSNAGLPDTSTLTINSGGTLDMNNINDTIGNLSGAGTVKTATGADLTLNSASSSTSFTGTINLGTGTLTRQSGGTTSLSGTNTMGAVNILANGRINVQSNGALGGTAPITITPSGPSGSAMLVNNVASTITLANPITINPPSSGVATTDIAANSGGRLVLNGGISGSGDWKKDNAGGAGTLVIGGTNNFTGDVTNASATLLVNGTTSGAGDVVVQAGNNTTAYGNTTLGGTGTLGMAAGKTVTLTGVAKGAGATNTDKISVLNAGDSTVSNGVGTLTIGTAGNGNSVKFGSLSRLQTDLDNDNVDLVKVNGNVDFGNSADYLLNIVGSGQTVGKYTVLSYTGSRTGTFATSNLNNYKLVYDDGNKEVDLQHKGTLAISTPVPAQTTVIDGAQVSVGVNVSNTAVTGSVSVPYGVSGTNISGDTGTAVASGSAVSHSLTFNTTGLGGGVVNRTVTATADNGTADVTNAGGAVTSASFSVDVLQHASASLTPSTANFGTVIKGANVTGVTAGLANAAGHRAALEVLGLGPGLSGASPNVAAGSSDTFNVTINTALAGAQNTTYTVFVSDDTSLAGATSLPNATAQISGTVLDHSSGSFDGAGLKSTTINLGTVAPNAGGGSISSFFDVFADIATAGYTAGLDLDQVVSSGDVGTLSVGGPNTFTNLAAGSMQGYTIVFDTTQMGTFTATYVFKLSDQDLLGATAPSSDVITLTVTGTVVPLPASAWMGLGLLGGIGAVRRFRKASVV